MALPQKGSLNSVFILHMLDCQMNMVFVLLNTQGNILRATNVDSFVCIWAKTIDTDYDYKYDLSSIYETC